MHNLEDAIARLHEDFDRVEFWAAAMDAFLKPIPEYEMTDETFLLPPWRAPTRPDRAP
jgi:hypothetical protein